MRLKNVRDIIFIMDTKSINDRLTCFIHADELNLSTLATKLHHDFIECRNRRRPKNARDADR